MKEHDATELAFKNGYKKAVQEMQEKLIKEAFCSTCGEDYSHHIIQIAKEMLDEVNKNG